MTKQYSAGELMRRIAVILFLLMFAPLAAWAQEDESAPQPSRVRWLVKFGGHMSRAEIADLARSLNAEAVDLGPYSSVWLLRFDSAPGEEAVEALLSNTGVTYAEREARYRTTMRAMTGAPDDPLHQRQWDHRMINLRLAHALNFGSDPSISIAILDSGVAYLDTSNRAMAPDLAGTIIHDGYDFVSDDQLAIDEGDGEIGHGTFLAGVAAQTTFNGRGTAGIAFNASLLPVRVVNRRGLARAGDVARGIRYAVVNGAAVVLLGFAGPADSRAVREAIEFAWDNGAAVIAPAGNSREVQYPARNDYVLSVGAVDAAGKRAYYSPEIGAVDIYAPGGDLREGVDADTDGYPDGILAESFLEQRIDKFEPVLMEGSSAAAAHVAGVAALLLSNAGPMTPDRLFSALRRGATHDGDLLLLNAGAALMRLMSTVR